MPFLWLSLAFCLGILAQAAWNVDRPSALALTGVSLALLWARRRGWLVRPTAGLARRWAQRSALLSELAALFPPPKLPWLALPLAAALGMLRTQAARPALDPSQVGYYASSASVYVVEGRVSDDPDRRDSYTWLRLQVEALHASDTLRFTPVQGEILARLPAGGSWRYGDRLRLTGYLQEPDGTESFDYADYLHKHNISLAFSCGARFDERCVQIIQRQEGFSPYAYIYAVRHRAQQVLARLLPDPESSLLAGILLGLAGGIPQGVQQAFKDTGTAHIIAISGYNFSIVAVFLTAIFSRLLGRWRGLGAACLGIGLYAVLAGAGAGVVRAALMGSLGVFGAQVGRRQVGVNSLLTATGLMALYDPWVLWDLSFQLSFAATLGLVLYAAPLQERFAARVEKSLGRHPALAGRISQVVGEYVLVTMAAQITTLPLMLYRFTRLSLAALLVNPLVLPIQPAIMLFGGLAACLGLVWLPVGQLAAWTAWPFLGYTIRLIELFAGLPAAAVTLPPIPAWLLAGYYLALAAATAYAPLVRRLFGLRSREQWLLTAAGAAAAAAALVWQQALTAPDGRLHMIVLDTGRDGRSGEALLVRSPSGRWLLIDGGPSPSALADSLGRRLPLLTPQLDAWIIASSREEAVAALPEALGRYAPSQAVWAASPVASYSARLLRRRLDEAGISQVSAQQGQVFDLGGGARLQFLRLNGKGAVLWLKYGYFRALLPVGLDKETLTSLPGDGPPGSVSALLLAESGHAALAPAGWLASWRPQLVVISVARGDRLGRPHPETLQAVQGYTILRTDKHGWIDIASDGRQMWVTAEQR